MARGRPVVDDSPLDNPRYDDHSAELWRDEPAEAARNLLNSAVRCFAAKGFQATTTRDISRGAGLSPAALYVHFTSKEDVLNQLCRIGHERVLEDVTVPADELPTNQLRALVSGHVTWHARHHVAARVAQYELANLSPEHLQAIRRLRVEYSSRYVDVITRGIDSGEFFVSNVRRMVRAITAMGIDLVRWYQLGGEESPEEIADFYADLAVTMVTSPKGASPRNV